MNKTCRKCNVKLAVNENFKAWRTKNSDYICNDCYNIHHTAIRDNRKDYHKKYRQSLKDKVYSVYLLENDNYVGVTQSIYNRISNHKWLGRDVNNMRILHQTKSREDALELEELLHDMGYEGKHTNNRYK